MTRRLALLAVLVPSLALAQNANNAQMSYEAVAKAPVGSWAEYTTTMKGRNETVKIRYALVEKTAKSMAIEIDGTTPMGPVLMRMEYQPTGADAYKISKAIMQMGTNAPQEMPVPPNAPLLKKGEEVGEPVGKTSIKTAAGTFDCKQFRKTIPQGTFDLWMNDKVLPVGLVKQASQDGTLMTILSATGTGATSKMSKLPPAKPAEKK